MNFRTRNFYKNIHLILHIDIMFLAKIKILDCLEPNTTYAKIKDKFFMIYLIIG